MKYLVLLMVGMWFAFLTVTQSFHAWERLLVTNNFSPASIAIVTGFTALIGFGYTMLLIMLAQAPIPRKQTLTYSIFAGCSIFMLFVLDFFIPNSPFDTMRLYMRADMFLRDNHHTILAWMDYSNTLLLFATTLWWVLSGVIFSVVFFKKKK